MKAKIKAVSMTLKVALLGMMVFAFAACGEGKEAWEFTDLSKAEFEALISDCTKNRKKDACAKLNEITESEDFCSKLISEKINENNYELAGNCYFDLWDSSDSRDYKDNNFKKSLEYYEKVCERAVERYEKTREIRGNGSCMKAADLYEKIAYDDEHNTKEKVSALIKSAELYDKACDLGLNFTCEKGMRQQIEKAKKDENLPEMKKMCSNQKFRDEKGAAAELMCDFILKKLQ